MEYLFVVTGLVCLFFGGDWLVRGAIALAGRMGLPAFLISLTIVGFGTSMPELLVSVDAALSGAPGIAIGNVVGSNIANILLIVGLAAMISPMRQIGQDSSRDFLVMCGSAVLLVAILLTGSVSFIFGLAMFGLLVCYLSVACLKDRGKVEMDLIDNADDKRADQAPMGPVYAVGLVAGGLVALAGGANLLVDGATTIATAMGVSNAVIGLTVVAVGTSLPELATSVVAAIKRQSDVAIGNVVGSNIFNILAILGITAMIAPVPVADRFVETDSWILLAATFIFAAILIWRKNISRLTGAGLLASYAAYMVTMG